MLHQIPTFHNKCFRSFFKACDFPPTDRDPLDLNFQPWARVTASDITCSNGKVSFSAHKQVLRVVSPFFQNALDGDIHCKAISLPDLSNECMCFVYRSIYGNRNCKERNLTLEMVSETLWKNLYLAAQKYDINILRQALLQMIFKANFQKNMGRFTTMLLHCGLMKDNEMEDMLYFKIRLLSKSLKQDDFVHLSNDVLIFLFESTVDKIAAHGAPRRICQRKGIERRPEYDFLREFLVFAERTNNKELLYAFHGFVPKEKDPKTLVWILYLKQSLLMGSLLNRERVVKSLSTYPLSQIFKSMASPDP